jgi:threonylcarbamoyladenosine tRNA methylthiotransferase MtaB
VKFSIFTTGCKANQWDSSVIYQRLKDEGFIPSSQAAAELAIINACTLTERAETDIRRFISRMRGSGRDVRIVLTGCHAQVYPEKAFGADLVLGQKEKFLVEMYRAAPGVVREDTRDFLMEKSCFNGTLPGRTRFFFKVQDGCDRFCSYCIVPYARGRVRSRPLPEIMQGMKTLWQKGIKEVVLTGIDIASYRDEAGGSDLKGMLRHLAEGECPPRIRLSSVDPGYIDEEFARILASSDKFAKSVHIPLQSASEGVLKRMGRRYGAESVKAAVKTLKSAVKTIGIGMDVMVGFPGEEEKDFLDTLHFLEAFPVSYLHVFPYSDRRGTRAYEMQDKVAESTKRERVRVLKRLDGRLREDFYKSFIGSRMRIVPEGKIYKGLYMRGYTDNYIPVYLPFQKSLENKVIDVTIVGMQSNMLYGEL